MLPSAESNDIGNSITTRLRRKEEVDLGFEAPDEKPDMRTFTHYAMKKRK